MKHDDYFSRTQFTDDENVRDGVTEEVAKDDASKDLGARLRKFRTSLNITQGDLARNCGLHKSSVSEMERGIKSPTISTLQRVCDGMGVTVAELFLFDSGEVALESDEAAKRAAALIRHLDSEDAYTLYKVVELVCGVVNKDAVREKN